MQQLFIKITRGKTVSLEVDGSDTLDVIKAKIKEMDECSLVNFDIRWELKLKPKRIELDCSEMQQLFIRTTTGKTITLEVEGSDTFDLVKEEIKYIAHECSLDNCLCFPTGMLLLIRTTTGKTITLEVEGSDTFDLVKEKIKDNCGIRWDLIPKPAVWWPAFCRPIFVRIPNGKTIFLAVEPGYKIRDLQWMIQDKEGICMSRQNLFLAGMSLEKPDMLEKYNLIQNYNVEAGSTLDLVLNAHGGEIEIFVETTDGKKISLKVLECVLIKELKALIQDKACIPAEQQRLVYAGEELEDTRLMETCYFQEKATLRLVDDAFMKRRERMRIHVQISAIQKTIHLDVESTDTIHAVKSKILGQEHIPTGQQVLFLPHKRLQEDAFTLADYFIQNESTIFLAQIIGDLLVV